MLQGEEVEDLNEVTFNLSGAMIYLGGKAKSIEEGIEISKALIKNGKAFDKFIEIVKLQKGDIKLVKDPGKYPKSKYSEKIYSSKTGYLKSIENYEIGIAALELGAGRITKEDKIDPKAGIIFYPQIGDKIKKGELIAEISTDKKEAIETVSEKIKNSLYFISKKINKQRLIKEIIR